MDRILVIILPLKNNAETIEIKYPEDLCRLLRLGVVALTVSNYSMSTNWELCLFCQEKKHNEKDRGETSSKIETQLKKFIEIDLKRVSLWQ